MSNYHNQFRPADLDMVLGQDHVVSALREYKRKNVWPHAFLFTGLAGTGKTTLSRIVGKELGADKTGIIEVDAAVFNGVDTMRSLIGDLQYTNLGESDIKFIILDECHMLSKSSWNSLLKVVEEPPAHVYFAFCTTESDKVPTTIQSRCTQFNLKPVPYSDLCNLLEAIVALENLPIPQQGIDLIARSAFGSPRNALTALNLCGHCTNLDEVRIALEEAEGDADSIELCRLLTGSAAPTWKKVVALLKRMDNKSPESIRLVVVNYVAKVLLGTTSEAAATKYLAVLEAFSKPCNPSEKMAPILLAVGTLLLSNPE